MKPIFYIGGSKGGVGKSKLAFALIYFFQTKDIPLLIIETDNSNPDVYKTHAPYENENFIVRQVNLDNANGWIQLVNLADEYDEHFMIINSAARSIEGIEKYSETLRLSLKELDRDFITFWMINRQRDSIELLKYFMNIFDKESLHVFMNNFFGSRDEFSFFDETKTKATVEDRGGKIVEFPELASRVADQLYSSRIPIAEGMKNFVIGDRAELKRWVQACEQVFLQLKIL